MVKEEEKVRGRLTKGGEEGGERKCKVVKREGGSWKSKAEESLKE